MKIFDKRAANTIPYPAKEVEKLSGKDTPIPQFKFVPHPVMLDTEYDYETINLNGFEKRNLIDRTYTMTCEHYPNGQPILNAVEALTHSSVYRNLEISPDMPPVPSSPYRTHKPEVVYKKLPGMWSVECEDCKDFAVYYGGMPTLFDTYDAAAKEAIEHARRNLITDEDPKNITSYTGFAQ
jgi:hypothetical protein